MAPVLRLLAPPRDNGAVEAGVGSLKSRLSSISAARGRAAHPTFDDLEAARLEANAQSRPWGPDGPTPDERWTTRDAITTDHRRRLHDAVAMEERREIAGMLRSLPEKTELGAHHRAVAARRATRRALMALGHLNAWRTQDSSTNLDPEMRRN